MGDEWELAVETNAAASLEFLQSRSDLIRVRDVCIGEVDVRTGLIQGDGVGRANGCGSAGTIELDARIVVDVVIGDRWGGAKDCLHDEMSMGLVSIERRVASGLVVVARSTASAGVVGITNASPCPKNRLVNLSKGSRAYRGTSSENERQGHDG